MAHLIDADKIRAEIEKRIEERVQNIKNGNEHTRPIDGSVTVALMSLLLFIDTLEKQEQNGTDTNN